MNGDTLWYVDGIRFVRLLFLRLLIKPRLFTDRIGCRLWLTALVQFHFTAFCNGGLRLRLRLNKEGELKACTCVSSTSIASDEVFCCS